MDCAKVGRLIADLRKEKGYTQQQLADKMNISGKTISKWECGQGCPDVSLLQELSLALGVNIENLLAGELESNKVDGGNMKRIKFYMCPDCGNILTATGEAEVSCCGRKLEAMIPQKSSEEHRIKVEKVDTEYYITFDHEMEKEHYLNFIAYVNYNSMHMVRLYPEQGKELRMPQLRGGRFYVGCSEHGVWVNERFSSLQ